MDFPRFEMPLQVVKVFSPARDEKDNLWASATYTMRGQQCKGKIVIPNGTLEEMRAHPAYAHLMQLYRSGENFQWFEVAGVFEARGYQRSGTHSFAVSVRLVVETMSRIETSVVRNEDLQEVPVKTFENK
ncbi:hypothetical protein BX616_007668, partial [Lobosporangium transversale]